MRICRFRRSDRVHVGFYHETRVVALASAAQKYSETTHELLTLPDSEQLLDFLPPHGTYGAEVRRLYQWLAGPGEASAASISLRTEDVELLVPNPRPNKLFLLAGNYAEHIREGGGMATERQETFPYVFMKPPSTTLTDPGKPVRVPSVSPAHVDWELELAVIIGRGGKGIPESDALSYVAGYTIINDISDRRFRPNPGRKQRERDAFFDWLHGKWHDSFCPCGPCVATVDTIPDPQRLDMKLRVNGKLFQDANTSQQIFPVAAVIEFISSFVTLEPGDMISTGTPAGVGNTTRTYLQPGDRVEGTIGSIGTLSSPVVPEGYSGIRR